MNKAIQVAFTIYLFLLLVMLISPFLIDISKNLHIAIVFLIFIPLVLILPITRYMRSFIIGASVLCLCYIFVLLHFRSLRMLFPYPKINSEKMVGFSQYFGYPFYFDTVLFFIIMLSPIVVILTIKIFHMYKK